jgi:Stage II sporulation protein E (SpoIIE)
VKILTNGDQPPALDVVFMDLADAGDRSVHGHQTTKERPTFYTWKMVCFLGRFPFATYSSVRLPLIAGDRVLLYTDGIPEKTNSGGRVWHRLLQAVSGG